MRRSTWPHGTATRRCTSGSLAALEKRAPIPLVHEQLEGALARCSTARRCCERTLQRMLTPAVRNQDLLGGALHVPSPEPETRPLVWSFIKDHFDTIQSTPWLPRVDSALCDVPGAFCDASAPRRAGRFFKEHPVAGAEATLAAEPRAGRHVHPDADTRGADPVAWLRETATADSQAVMTAASGS